MAGQLRRCLAELQFKTICVLCPQKRIVLVDKNVLQHRESHHEPDVLGRSHYLVALKSKIVTDWGFLVSYWCALWRQYALCSHNGLCKL